MLFSMGRLQMFWTAADSFFSNLLTHPQTQISLLNQQAAALTQVYGVHKAIKIHLQIYKPPIHCPLQAACTYIDNNVTLNAHHQLSSGVCSHRRFIVAKGNVTVYKRKKPLQCMAMPTVPVNPLFSSEARAKNILLGSALKCGLY